MKNPLVLLVGCAHYENDNTENLLGVKEDIALAEKVFKESFNYKVEKIVDPTHKQLQKFLKNWQTYLQGEHDHDGLYFFYSGHGEVDAVRLVNGRSMPEEKIKQMFDGLSLPRMVQTNRIFHFDTCRGPEVAEGIPDSEAPANVLKRHPRDGFFSFHANAIGYQAFGDEKGSHAAMEYFKWMEASKAADDNNKVDLQDLLTVVGNNVRVISEGKQVLSSENQSTHRIVLLPNPKKNTVTLGPIDETPGR